MRKLLLILALISASLTGLAQVKIDKDDCSITKDDNKFNLYGRVRIVDDAEDIRIKIVTDAEDLRVIIRDYTPDNCGEIRIVDYAEDIRVKIVEDAEDIRVRIVDYAPGLRD